MTHRMEGRMTKTDYTDNIKIGLPSNMWKWFKWSQISRYRPEVSLMNLNKSENTTVKNLKFCFMIKKMKSKLQNLIYQEMTDSDINFSSVSANYRE